MSKEKALFALLGRYFPHICEGSWQITPLAGLSGGSYLLEGKQSECEIKIVAREDGKTQSSLYIHRHKEARILKQLKQAVYAPKLIGRNGEWLLLQWCEGQHPDNASFLSPDFQHQLAKTVAQLHCSSLFNYCLPLRNEISHYGYLIDNRRLSPRWKRLHHHFLCAPMPKTLKLAPAHMDIHRGNIISNAQGQLVLLDWEYAANTDIAFSLETYFQFNRLTHPQRDFFLTQYCVGQGAYRDKKRLAEHCQLWTPWVKYMALMWYEVRWNQSHQSQFLLQSQPLRQYFSLLG